MGRGVGEDNHCSRYNINGFVRELPRLPEKRWRHACAGLPSSGVRRKKRLHDFFFTNAVHVRMCTALQAFIVAGGVDGSTWVTGYNIISSVLTLLPGATAWTPLASLPRLLHGA